jgi:hypothetical protein
LTFGKRFLKYALKALKSLFGEASTETGPATKPNATIARISFFMDYSSSFIL